MSNLSIRTKCRSTGRSGLIDTERTTLSLTILNPLVPFTIPFRLSSTSWVGCERACTTRALFLSPASSLSLPIRGRFIQRNCRERDTCWRGNSVTILETRSTCRCHTPDSDVLILYCRAPNSFISRILFYEQTRYMFLHFDTRPYKCK